MRHHHTYFQLLLVIAFGVACFCIYFHEHLGAVDILELSEVLRGDILLPIPSDKIFIPIYNRFVVSECLRSFSVVSVSFQL